MLQTRSGELVTIFSFPLNFKGSRDRVTTLDSWRFGKKLGKKLESIKKAVTIGPVIKVQGYTARSR